MATAYAISKYYNITSDLTKELITEAEGVNARSIIFCNKNSTHWTVDLYVEKALTGKFYIFKDMMLSGNDTIERHLNLALGVNGFGLFVKINKGSGITPAVDIIIK